MFTDFIGIFDDVLTQEECQQFIDYFEELKKLNLSHSRQQLKDGHRHNKSDETVFILQHDMLPIHRRNPVMSVLLDKFWKCYDQYASEFSILADTEPHGMMTARLQKTLPGEGYHRWHFEASSSEVSTRVAAWSLYLNDVEHGGETEFLYQKRRVSAKAGRLVIWPAAFTHTHRGNPPLSGEKYLLTGWLEFLGNNKL
jgi:hypothetical protein